MKIAARWPRTMRQSTAAQYVERSPADFARMVAAGVMPPPFDLDGADAWDMVDLDAAIDALKAGARTGRNWKERAPARA